MRSTVRLRILITCGVLVAAGVGGWQLLPSDDVRTDPITIGTTDEVTSLDPAGAWDAGSWAMYSNVYQTLLTFKPGVTTPVPDAAKSCKFVGARLTTYECELRDDLTFSNGRKVTGEDVEHSFERILDIKADAGPAPLLPTLKDVVADGQKVTFNLNSRDATFPLKLTTGAGSIVDRSTYPAKKVREGSTVDGSGPYVIKEFKPGESARLEPNPKYRGAAKSGPAVVVRYFTESEQLATAWKTKQIDIAHRQMPPEFLSTVGNDKDSARITEAQTAEVRNLYFNVKSGSPMAKKAVRQAVAAVIDRPAIVTGAYHGTVEPLYSLIPQGYNGHSTSFYDAYPEPSKKKAKSLLKDADVETPVSFTLGYRRDATYAAEAKEMKRQLEASGLFKVKLVEAEWQEFQKGYANGEYDAYPVGWLPDFPDSDSFTAPLVGAGNAMHNGFSSSKIDSLIAATQQYSDRAAAANDFEDIQTEVVKEVPLIPLWQKKDYVLATTEVAGSQYLTDGTGVWRLWELGWI
ncbi:ABC transporter substrate-binding protein [Streptomyces sp. P9(2023)]|uniref:ABC transporter substrate-binding protein n=1 Tax=Streptomyces sp. P9(2023) TaxID=3064394 RepID=UPI0028F41CFC|nr:ABC transporter substrate-binding protein [Streptomyces sp. P9(2023)]MDT9688756.1 ABC transporter substrate-binding protein [Streptomyces sp. P9(2023)]